ncbi:MAG: hypothetical protein V2A57_04220 [Elusimicrobiota bacterium]
MKPQSILEFYRRCESKYDDLPALKRNDAEKILQGATLRAYSHLKTLFGKDEKIMFYMLQYLLWIPSLIKRHKETKKLQRETSKKISQKTKRFEKKVEQQVKDFIALYRYLNPDVDNETLKDLVCNCSKLKRGLQFEAEILNDTIANCKKESWQGKTNAEFNQIIYNIFVMSEGKLNDIAKLLNSLNFKTPQGNSYTKENIKHYCKTPS